MKETFAWRGGAALVALMAASLVAAGLPGCRPAGGGLPGRRPANAALRVLASGSLEGKLRAVG